MYVRNLKIERLRLLVDIIKSGNRHTKFTKNVRLEPKRKSKGKT